MSEKGWILLHRRIQDCEIWQDNSPFDNRSAWIDLLMLANHRDVEMIFDYKPMVVHRGQYLTSVRQLSARWSWSKNRVLKFLRLLESLKMIERDSNNQRTVLTIVKYEFYQCDWDTNMDTHVDAGVDAGMPQTNNVKNEKKKLNNRAFVKPSVEEVREYCQQRKNSVDPETFVDFYESKGWKVGKNPMKDWKACVRTWEKSWKQKTKSNSGAYGRTYDFDALERMME